MKGYVGNKEATEDAIDEEGWYHTGDIGKYTTEGVLYITGRAKELMKIDGHQVCRYMVACVIVGMYTRYYLFWRSPLFRSCFTRIFISKV